MSKTRRWVIAILLLLPVGIAGNELSTALLAAPVAQIEQAFHPPAGVHLPSVMTPIAVVVPPSVAPLPEAPKAAPARSHPRSAAARPADVGAVAALIYPDRALPPLPSPVVTGGPQLSVKSCKTRDTRGCASPTAAGPMIAVPRALPAPRPVALVDSEAEDGPIDALYARGDHAGAVALARALCGRGDAFACAVARTRH